jgi:small subunit ribosomal protein S9
MVNDKEKYFYSTGRRKTAIAKVRIYENETKPGVSINDQELGAYFSESKSLMDTVYAPLEVLNLKEKFFVSVKVLGGGIHGQAEAIRLGISRALLKMKEDYKKDLKVRGYLTRDPREVERKKPGLKKARRSPQWKKR